MISHTFNTKKPTTGSSGTSSKTPVGPNDTGLESFNQYQKSKSGIPKEEEFDIEADPDMPPDAVNSNVIVEEIEMNGKK